MQTPGQKQQTQIAILSCLYTHAHTKLHFFFFTLWLFSILLCCSLSFVHWGQCSNRESREGLPGCPQRSPNIILQIHAHAGQAVLQLWFTV